MIQVACSTSTHYTKLNRIIIFALLVGIILSSYYLSVSDKVFDDTLPETTIHSGLLLPHKKRLLIRQPILQQMGVLFNKQNSDIQSVILIGDGGVGKTILSRLYALSQKNFAVIWEINAETRSSCLSSLKNLAYALATTPEKLSKFNLIHKIANPLELEKQLLLFVKQRLKEETSWLLIYDNVDAISDIKDLLPKEQEEWGRGKLIISSRDMNISSYFSAQNTLIIKELDQQDALALFTNICYGCSVSKLSPLQLNEMIKFIKQIPAFPLDISLAAYHIKNIGMTYEQYLVKNKTLTEAFESLASFLANSGGYTKTRFGIISTALTKIIQITPEFKYLLLLICMLDSQEIPKHFLERFEDPQTISHFLHELKKYCLVTIKEPLSSQVGTTIALHRAVQSIGFVFLKNLFSSHELEMLSDNILRVIQSFEELKVDNESYHSSVRKVSGRERLLLVPHLQSLIKLSQELNVADALKEKLNLYITLLISCIQKNYGHNMLLAKQSLEAVYRKERQCQYLTPEVLAVTSFFLGNIHVNLAEPDAALPYLKQSLSLCDGMPQSELLQLSNLNLMGVALSQKEDAEEAEKFFQLALQVIADNTINDVLKKDREAWIYMQMATHYSKYLHKGKALEAEKYILKALAIQKATHTFHKRKESNRALLSIPVAKIKARLGMIYSRLGKYHEAVTKGLQDAMYVLKNGEIEDKFLEAEINCDTGEIFLREGKLEEAEKILTKSIELAEFLLGKESELAWQARVYRIEALLRLKKLKEAYQDCQDIFVHIKKVIPYSRLLYSTGHYHAAMVHYLMGDNAQSKTHLINFFKYIELYCRTFLDTVTYQTLYNQGLFITDVSNLTHNFKKGVAIFTAIYGASNPFVKDYIIAFAP